MRMEEQEEGIFAEIKKHSEMTNNKGKTVEVTVVENKTVNRPKVKDDSIMGVESGGEIDQFNEDQVDQVSGNEVSNNIIKCEI